MNRASRINFVALTFVGLAAGGLGGCGRAGPLEPPPDARAIAKQNNAAENNSGLPQPHQQPKQIEAPKQPFLLDPLL